MVNCFYDCYNILNKVYSQKAFLKQAILDTEIEQKNKPLTIKICYGVLDNDALLSFYIKSLTEKSPKLAIRIILKIAMFCIKNLGKKEYAVTLNAVELVKKLGKGGTSGFVNAFLRKFISSDIELPKDEITSLSLKYSYPDFAVEQLYNTYGKDLTIKILNAEKGYTTLAFYDTDGESYLKNAKADYQKTPFTNVFLTKNFVRDQGFDKGLYTFQALGSVAICEVVKPCENLLDCCAAPGGKSVRLSYKCKNITSWDIHEHRVKLIESYKNRLKRDNVFCAVKDAKIQDKGLEDYFDGVLVDAPCSGLGVVNDNPDIKLNRSKQDLISLNNEQLAILNTVAKYLKVGGYLYYSTCSILKSENQDIITKFLSQNDNFVCQPISSPLCSEYNLGLTFLPHITGGLGFFVCALKRVK